MRNALCTHTHPWGTRLESGYCQTNPGCLVRPKDAPMAWQSPQSARFTDNYSCQVMESSCLLNGTHVVAIGPVIDGERREREILPIEFGMDNNHRKATDQEQQHPTEPLHSLFPNTKRKRKKGESSIVPRRWHPVWSWWFVSPRVWGVVSLDGGFTPNGLKRSQTSSGVVYHFKSYTKSGRLQLHEQKPPVNHSSFVVWQCSKHARAVPHLW